MKSKDNPDDYWVVVASAWQNERGNLTIRLRKGTVLDWHDNEDYTLLLVPNDE